MRDAENIRAVKASGADIIGLIFYQGSPRHVDSVPETKLAGAFADTLPETDGMSPLSGVDTLPETKLAGVFVDEDIRKIAGLAEKLDYIQLHGHEDKAYCEELRRSLPTKVKIIKALPIASERDLCSWREYRETADLLLFDTKTALAGGSGQSFDWDILKAYEGDTPFLLSGGIGPEDAARVLEFSHPRLAGIDLNSRFETSPGMKDAELLRKFIQKIRNHE